MDEQQRAMVPAFVQGAQRVAVGAPPEGAETPTAAGSSSTSGITKKLAKLIFLFETE